MKFEADVHVHSTHSDSSRSVENVFDFAKHIGLKGIAITDHNVAVSEDELLQESKRTGIEYVTGMELSCEYQGEKVDVLCYGIDPSNENIRQYSESYYAGRKEHALRVVDAINQSGYSLNPDMFTTTRPQDWNTNIIMNGLIEQGLANDFESAKEIVIAHRIPYERRMEVHEGIKFCRENSGVPVLAHPFYYIKEPEILEGLVATSTQAGLLGIEAYYTSHTPEQNRICTALGQKYNLLITGGSDDHGDRKPGFVMGNSGMPYENFLLLKEAIKNCQTE